MKFLRLRYWASRLREIIRSHAMNRRWGSDAIAKIARYYFMSYHAALPFLPHQSGELNLFGKLEGFGFRHIIDAGANVGDWTATARKHFPDAHVHAFEIAPETAQRLASRFADDPEVLIRRVGLSNNPGEAALTFFPREHESTGIGLPSKTGSRDHDAQILHVPVITGADYLSEQMFEPDFLKVDCEGHDLEVLLGFGESLHRIPIIQFEFNDVSLFVGQTLKHFYDALPQHRIGKLYPYGVRFREHALQHHLGFPGNFVAVRNDRTDIIDAVSVSR